VDRGARHVTNYFKAMAMETAALARACGKSNVHNLEPNDLVALTVEASAMAQVPLAAPTGSRAAKTRSDLRRSAMYEKILVAIDHSAPSDRALAAARELAGLAKAEVWVLHVREREVIPRLGLVPTEEGTAAEDEVKAAVSVLAYGGVTAHAEVGDVTFGQAALEIVEVAKRHDVGVIVMGSRGRSDLAGLVLGSTAHKVIHLTNRPADSGHFGETQRKPGGNGTNSVFPMPWVPSYPRPVVS
jgi:nucleotide-binding universal stress UspA family protein